MPYELCRPLTLDRNALWAEGAPYVREPIYAARPGEPPVFYDRHHLALHSFCHVESMKHVERSGRTVDQWSMAEKLRLFWGPTAVVKVAVTDWAQDGSHRVYRVTREDLESAWQRLRLKSPPSRMLIAPKAYTEDAQGYHAPHDAFVLDVAACEFWVSKIETVLLGTSYRSIDFEPRSRQRPIHERVLHKGAAMELLDLQHVPEGLYVLTAQPIPLVDASETLVAPWLWTFEEWKELATPSMLNQWPQGRKGG